MENIKQEWSNDEVLNAAARVADKRYDRACANNKTEAEAAQIAANSLRELLIRDFVSQSPQRTSFLNSLIRAYEAI